MKRFYPKPTLIASVCVLALCVACSDDDDSPVAPTNEDPTVRITSPNGGELIAPGETVEIEWVVEDDSDMVGFDLSYEHMESDGDVAIATEVEGTTFSWTVPAETLFGVKLKIVATDDGGKTDEDESDDVFAVVNSSARGYVQANVCRSCHEQKYNDLFDSGHPYKLNKVVGGEAPTYPFSQLRNPPSGYTWDDITYVIGGYGWKARFLNSDGFILISGIEGTETQYNLPRDDLGGGLSAEWVNYEGSRVEPKPYTCGTCHTTGWLTTAENGGVNQDGLPGIQGTWEETGITCEACHGPGGSHVATMNSGFINIDRGSELCGSCHYRDTNHGILASGGFIKHHEQYDEMISAGHGNLSCTTCHDPHKGVRYGHADQGGLRETCEGCHSDVTRTAHDIPLDCESCHMPRASKSARKVSDFEGDVMTHIFKIQSAAVGRNDPDNGMFYEEDGSTFSRGHVTLDFVCYQCHEDPVTGGGGDRTALTLQELSSVAKGIHN